MYTTRRAALAASRQAFGVLGLSGASLAHIAEQAGVTAATLCHHFGGKQGLYDAAADEVYAELGALAQSIDPSLSLAELIDAVYAHAERNAEGIRFLMRQIAERGCVVSESPVGARAQAKDFPRRNRIISGLSRGVIVVEAELKSGSLITARLANEQGRDVFAVPGSPLDPRSRGPNELLRQGAILCEGLEDVEREFGRIRTVREPGPGNPFAGAPDDIDDVLVERVAALLSPTPTPRDELARAAGAPVGAVAAALLELSLCGRATLLPGGMASL